MAEASGPEQSPMADGGAPPPYTAEPAEGETIVTATAAPGPTTGSGPASSNPAPTDKPARRRRQRRAKKGG